jgi:phage-related protein
MAVIGHAEIIVRAVTNNFEKELKSTLSNISKSVSIGAGKQIGDGFADGFNRSNAASIFGKVSDGLRSMVPEAEGARQTFQSLTRTGFVLQGALGLIAGAISSVVVSIGPLIGSLLAAAPAAVALANGLVAIQLASRVGKAAFGDIAGAVSNATKAQGGYNNSLQDALEKLRQLRFEAEEAALSQERAALNLESARESLLRAQEFPVNSRERREAELQFREAELAYRRAKDRNNQTKKELAKGVQGQMSGGGAGSDPFAGLNSAQKTFAQYLITLQPRFQKLELSLSKAFLTPLKDAVDVLMDELMPVLESELPGIAKTTGDALKGIAIEASTPENAARLQKIFSNSNPIIKKVGDIIENLLTSILTILEASDGVAQTFFTWLETLTGGWADSLEMMGEDGSLKKFFDNAGVEAARWGTIIGNIFDGFGNLITLTTGPGSAGEYMLDWFTEASEGFKNLFADDPEAGKNFFKDAMVNARSVLSSIGALVSEILGVADNPNIAVAFDALKEGAPGIGNMLDSMIDAAPSFANLITTVTKIAEGLVDEGQLEGFFDTLNEGAEALLGVINTDAFKKIMDNIGPIIGALSALGVMVDAVFFGFQVAVGYLAFGSALFEKPLAMLKTGFGFIKDFFKSPLKGGLLAVVILLITKTVEFYNRFQDFRDMIDGVAAGIGDAFGNLGESLGELFDALMGDGGLGGLIAMLDPIIKKVLEIVIPFIGGVIEFVINGISTAIDFITSLVKSVMDVIGGIAGGLQRIFQGDIIGGIMQIVGAAINTIVGVVQGILNGVITAINVFIDFVNGIISSVANSPAAQYLGFELAPLSKIELLDLTGAVAKGFSQIGGNRSTASSGEGNRFKSLTPRMAEGGVVYPSDGGTMVTVAEAGRPERIEPLDSNGLSERDIAMIQEISGGSGVEVNVYAAPGMDINELTRAISRQMAMEIKRGAI